VLINTQWLLRGGRLRCNKDRYYIVVVIHFPRLNLKCIDRKKHERSRVSSYVTTFYRLTKCPGVRCHWSRHRYRYGKHKQTFRITCEQGGHVHF
jgi:hypothetical protein